MKKRNGWIGLVLLFLVTATGLTGCGRQGQEGSYSYQIYYVNKDNTKVVGEEYLTDTESSDTQALLAELLGKLGEIPEKPEYNAPLAASFSVDSYELNEGQLHMVFTEEYRDLEPISEILYRAAIVRTVTQIENVDTVTFSIMGEALTDAIGMPVGTMTADSFVDNAGTEINAYAEAALNLYFASASGDKLVEVDRNVIYNSNISLEKQVMDELIKGPQEGENGYPAINPATSVLGVTVKDGVCYVNLSQEFLTQIYDVTSDVTLYSIANSMAELPNVNKVQISVDGETDITYREAFHLTTVFERNLDIVEETG